MDDTTTSPARRWAATWQAAWPLADSAAIAALYAPGAPYRSHPFRMPEAGSARGYTSRVFAEEAAVRCRFGTPIESGGRAAVEWWAVLEEGGREITLAGTTVLHFDERGLVTRHVDYWVDAEGAAEPFDDWGR